MADRRAVLRQSLRVGPVLALVAAVGFLLGACAGDDGSALTTRTGLTGTAPALTPTRTGESVPTRPTLTETVTTSQATTVVTTSEVTATETTTTSEPATTTSEPTTTAPSVTVVAPPAEEEADNSVWAWLALAAALLAALGGGFLIWHRSRARASSWSSELADLERRVLVELDEVVGEGSVVTGQVQALAADARSLEERARDDSSRAAAARLRARLDELASTLAADRTLRLSSPPPSAEQISYSTALIREQVEQLQGVLRPSGEPPA